MKYWRVRYQEGTPSSCSACLCFGEELDAALALAAGGVLF